MRNSLFKPRSLILIVDGESALKKTISRFPRLQHTIIVAALVAPLLSFTSAPAHAVAATCAEGGVCQVGDIGPGGGIVFYVAPTTFTQIGASGTMCTTNCKYLEAARISIWGDNSSDPAFSWTIVANQASAVTGADGTVIGSGYQNSVDILNQGGAVIGSSTAAAAARAFTGGSKSDWYLPSTDELNELYLEKTAVGGFGNNWYWSSTEAADQPSEAAWGQNFGAGFTWQLKADKGVPDYVRPIRAFAPATKISITRAAVGTQRGAAFTTQPQITIQYANNETVTASSAVVTASINSGGTLVGTTTATASSGVATFSNLGVNGTIGTTYTISYTVLDLTVASATVTLTGTTCNGSTFACQVGDIGPGGGKIFYVAPTTFTQIGASGTMCTTNCKYLEAAPNTWSGGSSDPSLAWATNINSNQTTAVTGADGTAIGTGYQNSLDIVAQTGNVAASSAAVAARGYAPTVLGTTYSDWYLPSKDELYQLYIRRTSVGGFVVEDYWSSSEVNSFPHVARAQYFYDDDDFSVIIDKSGSKKVRPIRAFGSAPAEVISVAAIGGVTAPVVGATPVTTVTSANGYTGTVTWSGSPTTFAGATTYTATITLTAAAGYTLTGVSANFFTVAGTSSSATNSINSGVITAAFPATAVGPATKGLMTTQPSGAVNGAAFTTQPVVRVTDVDGNTNTSFTGNVVASIATGTGTLSGTTTVAAVSGIATFTNLVITGTLGNFTLRFTPASLTTIDSSSFALEAPSAATNIAITRAAVGTKRGVAFTTQPQITIQYANNETVTASSAVVTATISSGGTLVGTTTATASSGVATFSNLGVDGTVGTTYTISYTALDLPIASATVTLTGTTCNGATFICQIGDTGPGGGKIFYVAPTTFTQIGASGTMCTTNCKYLEVAPNTWSGGNSDPSITWATDINSTPAGAFGTAIGTGYENSLKIVDQYGNVAASSAAVAARGYTSIVSGTTYTDWHLPSKDELNQLYLQNTAVGGVWAAVYWSSTESNANAAWTQNFGIGDPAAVSKDTNFYVRPIRAFGVAPTTISVFAIGGVTAPVRGGTPVNAVTAANGYTGTITWSGAPTIFAPSTVYTATITLTADTGYTLVGVAANSFTVAGATSVMHSFDSGVITAVFAATAADPIVQEVRTDPMLPITRPQISISEAAIMCSIGTYSQRPSSSVFSLFEDGRHIGTIFSAVGDYLPDWIIPWATSATITRTATLTSASWVMSETYQGKSITCSVLAYSNHATGLILSDVVVIN